MEAVKHRLDLVLVLILLWIVGSLAGLSCMDNNGRHVDWFIVYKLPDDDTSPIDRIKNGSAFMYMDVKNQAFKMSDVSLDNKNQAIGFTLQQVYGNYKSKVSRLHNTCTDCNKKKIYIQSENCIFENFLKINLNLFLHIS